MSEQQNNTVAPSDAAAPDEEPQLELETGPLMPPFVSLVLYTATISWIIFAAVWIGWKMVLQHRVVETLDLIGGPWSGGEAPAFESVDLKIGLDTMTDIPRESLLYVVQELLQDPIDDENMSRAISLRKAVVWGEESARRDALKAILEAMRGEKGELPPGYELQEEGRQTIEMLVEDRKSGEERQSYEQERITAVLEWVLAEKRAAAVGPERRRVKALLGLYEKKLFFGTEARTLDGIREEWLAGGDAVKKAAAEKFTLMLEGQRTALSEAGSELCGGLADQYEGIYRLGRERLAQVAHMLVTEQIAPAAPEDKNGRIDHPEIWDLARMTEHEYPEVAEKFADTLYALRDRKFVVRFVGGFLAQDAVNPVMAVATDRLTADEHRSELYKALQRRRRLCLDVLERIGLAYYRGEFEFRDLAGTQEPDPYMNVHVIETLESILEDDMPLPDGSGTVGERAREVLTKLQQAQGSRSSS